MWIKRDFSEERARKGRLPLHILTGPRQVGKTHLLTQALSPKVRILDLDDLGVRQGLRQDPALYLGEIHSPLLIDEAQFAPEVFHELKLRVDRARREEKSLPPIWLTGSSMTLLDREVKESLAGRASYHSLHGLSVHELGENFEFGKALLRGGWPALYRNAELDPIAYLDDYLRSFVEKDIALLSGIEKTDAFLKALRLLAGRTAQVLNASEVGAQAGVKGETLSEWIGLLDRHSLVKRLPAFFRNANKRLIKSPKIYFTDIGLAARLQGWRSADPLLVSPAAGPLFETLVYSEILKARDHFSLPIEIHFYRTKDGEEVDFLLTIETGGGRIGIAIESKLAIQGNFRVSWPKALEIDFPELREKWVVTLGGDHRAAGEKSKMLPIRELTDALLEAAK